MSDPTFPLSPLGEVAERCAAQLNDAADPWLAAFFGADPASVGTLNEASLTVRVPGLYVIPQDIAPERLIGGRFKAVAGLLIRAYLPLPTPARASLTVPAAPTVSASAVADWTGGSAGVTYRLTAVYATGQSLAGAASTAAPGSHAPLVTFPAPGAGQLAWNVWRAAPGRSYYRHAATVPVSRATWTDPYLEAELGDAVAPVKDLGNIVRGAIAEVLFAEDGEELPGDGILASYGAAKADFPRPSVDTARNLMTLDLPVTYLTAFDLRTGDLNCGPAAP